jgi:hypothetical protein
MFGRSAACLLLLLLAPAAALAGPASGPPVGKEPPPLKVYDVTGPHKEMELDYVADRKEKPRVFILVRVWDRPVARFLKRLDTALAEENTETLLVAVWLTDEKEATKQYLPRAQQSLQLQKTALTLFPGDKAGPDGWNVNPEARVTVVVVGPQKVAATFGYDAINETDVPAVREAIKKAGG